ncbi:ABC transporter permease [Aminobacter anthyllidis]|uniref:ABC transporter permease n=1 Tax=Aminobacter anthyllidis TaxID=1035067 RepID=A0A9X1D535_9HYPH|nr:ABC transporter permease [Aminobacter anthyllidis]MBT1156782.1 ABC transporter permease [Aminobacter anthyllidis]
MTRASSGVEKTIWDRLFTALVAAIYIFLMFPIVLVVVLSFNSGEFLAFPLEGFSLRWFEALFSNKRFLDATLYSLQIAATSTIVNGVIGTLAAIYVARHATVARDYIRLLMTSPLLVPEILTAIALLFYFYEIRIGTDYSIGIQIGHIVVTFPYVFLNVSSALFNFDRSQEEAARSLGAGGWMTFRRVTLPAIKPGIITGCLFAFVISFDIFNISLLLKSLGKNTLPLELFDYLRFNFDPTAAAIASLSIFMTFAAILIIDRTVGLRSLRF